MDKKTTENFSKTRHKINNLLASSSLSIEMLLRGVAGKPEKEQKKYLRSALLDLKKIAKELKKTKKTD